MSTKQRRRCRALFAVLAELNEPPRDYVHLARATPAGNVNKRETPWPIIRAGPLISLRAGAPKGRA